MDPEVAPSGASAADVEGTVTRLLVRARGGDATALESLFEIVYDELRRRARARLGRSAPGGLDGTALVHEVCAKLLSRETLDARDRNHFFAIFSRAMRDAIVDAVRRDGAERRGGGAHHETVVDFVADGSLLRIDVLAIEEALADLRAVDADAAQMIDLRVFGGMTLAEAAELTGVTSAVARGHWDYGRAWLSRRLEAIDRARH